MKISNIFKLRRWKLTKPLWKNITTKDLENIINMVLLNAKEKVFKILKNQEYFQFKNLEWRIISAKILWIVKGRNKEELLKVTLDYWNTKNNISIWENSLIALFRIEPEDIVSVWPTETDILNKEIDWIKKELSKILKSFFNKIFKKDMIWLTITFKSWIRIKVNSVENWVANILNFPKWSDVPTYESILLSKLKNKSYKYIERINDKDGNVIYDKKLYIINKILD